MSPFEFPAASNGRRPPIVYVNDAFRAETGHAPSDVIGRSIELLLPDPPNPADLAWLDEVSGRLLVNIIYRYLRDPLRHNAECEALCAKGCQVRAFEEALAAPVLPSEAAEAEREEARFKALARGEIPD